MPILKNTILNDLNQKWNLSQLPLFQKGWDPIRCLSLHKEMWPIASNFSRFDSEVTIRPSKMPLNPTGDLKYMVNGRFKNLSKVVSIS